MVHPMKLGLLVVFWGPAGLEGMRVTGWFFALYRKEVPTCR